MKPPILYFGAKGTIAERIVDLMPAHVGYIEPYAGSLAVLLAKPQAKMEVVNDLDGEIMTFWRVLRDRTDELMHVAALTPHSRAEHEQSREREGLNELELARRVWVRLTQGRSGTLSYSGWRYYRDPTQTGSAFAKYMDAYKDRMPAAAARLLEVSLECRDALDVIRDYGAADSNLLYVDPPYVGSTRSHARYIHEMRDDDAHRRMAEALQECDAAVLVSGYASELYDRELFPDWDRHEFVTFTGNGARDTRRVEVLWSNREINHGQLDFGGLA